MNAIMKRCLLSACLLVLPLFSYSQTVSGELKTWHKVTVSFDGPQSSEQADENPFLNYRLNVTFKNGDKTITVPGYFAADGNAAESGADSGNQWRAHFTPDETGEWTYAASFRKGADIAVNGDTNAGEATAFDGATGSFIITKTDKTGRDFRGKGTLRYAGERYLQFAETGEYYLKGGADSPENFLGYFEFDQTYYSGKDTNQRAGEAAPQERLHRYAPHARDWNEGDPTWRGGKGKNIIGALNYLASEGMNSVYFLTMNVNGDGKDVWMWTGHEERYRFDCSKLDQWEIVFQQMTKLGLALHVITQETENDQLLDEGELGKQRKLYYRELIARFSHHPALVWNLGEENTNTTEQIKSFAKYIHELDPYKHEICIHTYPGQYDKVYGPLLGDPHLQGASLQMGDMNATYDETLKWINRSAEKGHKWVVNLDEIGPANIGVLPDAEDPDHDQVRKKVLWGNLMAGGGGAEWYFGYNYAHTDLNCEDWRTRDKMWDQTRHALEFFQTHLPFAEMQAANNLTGNAYDYCFAKPGDTYAIYLPEGGITDLRLEEGDYTIHWYNPRTGGELQTGRTKEVKGGVDRQFLGYPPSEPAKDWVILVRRK